MLFLRWTCEYTNVNPSNPHYRGIEVMRKSTNSSFIQLAEAFGIIIGCQWFKVLLILQASKTFGPIIEIIIQMIKKLFIYALLMVMVIGIHVSVGTIFFIEIEEFSSFGSASLYLFESMLGNFDFDIFKGDLIVRDEYKYIFM